MNAQHIAIWRQGLTAPVREGVGGYNDFSFSIQSPSISAVPEPDQLLLSSVGMLLMAAQRKGRKAG